MKQLIAKPNGWPCTYAECPPGHMKGTGQYENCVWFKSEYRDDNKNIIGYNEAGEFLCIEPTDMVQPITFQWVDE